MDCAPDGWWMAERRAWAPRPDRAHGPDAWEALRPRSPGTFRSRECDPMPRERRSPPAWDERRAASIPARPARTPGSTGDGLPDRLRTERFACACASDT